MKQERLILPACLTALLAGCQSVNPSAPVLIGHVTLAFEQQELVTCDGERIWVVNAGDVAKMPAYSPGVPMAVRGVTSATDALKQANGYRREIVIGSMAAADIGLACDAHLKRKVSQP